MLVRYLFEYQYLGALGSRRIADPATFFLASTWFDDDFLATGVLDERASTRWPPPSRASARATRSTRSRLRLPVA